MRRTTEKSASGMDASQENAQRAYSHSGRTSNSTVTFCDNACRLVTCNRSVSQFNGSMDTTVSDCTGNSVSFSAISHLDASLRLYKRLNELCTVTPVCTQASTATEATKYTLTHLRDRKRWVTLYPNCRPCYAHPYE